MIREIFPDVDISYERGRSYNGNPAGRLTVVDVQRAVEVASVTQRQLSEEFSHEGDAIERLKRALRVYKDKMDALAA